MRGCSRGQLRSGPPSTDDSAAQPSTENEQAASETGPETATNHEPGQSLSNELPPELDGKSDHVTRVENPCRSRVWLMKLPEWDPFTGGTLDREKVRETLKRYHDEMREGNFSGASSSAALQDGPEALRLWMAEIEADCRWIAGARAAHQAAVPAKSRKRQDGGNEEPAPAAAGASNDSGAEPAAGPQPAAPGTGPQPALAGAPPAGPPPLPAAAPPPAAPAPEYDGAMVPVAALAPVPAAALAPTQGQLVPVPVLLGPDDIDWYRQDRPVSFPEAHRFLTTMRDRHRDTQDVMVYHDLTDCREFHWRAWVSHRPDAETVVGPGIIRFAFVWVAAVDDNLHEKRGDFLISRADGVDIRLHPQATNTPHGDEGGAPGVGLVRSVVARDWSAGPARSPCHAAGPGYTAAAASIPRPLTGGRCRRAGGEEVLGAGDGHVVPAAVPARSFSRGHHLRGISLCLVAGPVRLGELRPAARVVQAAFRVRGLHDQHHKV